MGTSASFPSQSSLGESAVTMTAYAPDVIHSSIEDGNNLHTGTSGEDNLQIVTVGRDQSEDTVVKEESSNEHDENETSIYLKKDHILQILNKVILRICQMSSLQNEDGSLREELLSYFKFIGDFYYALKSLCPAAYDVVKKFRCNAGQRLSETKIISLMCNIAIHVWKATTRPEEDVSHINKIRTLQTILTPLWCYSDCSPEVTYDIAAERDFLETLKEILNIFKVKCTDEKVMTSEEGLFIQAVLSIFHNTSSVDSNINHIRIVDINNVLQSYLDSDNEEYRLTALATLASIVNEKECSLLQKRQDIVKFLLDIFGTALQNKDHRSSGGRVGWSAQECATTVRNLARNDANKKLVVDMGCLPHLVELAKSDTIDEQKEAVSAIWFLSFDVDNQKKMKEDKQLDILMLLNDRKENSDDQYIQIAADGALWNLEQKAKPKERWKKAIAAILKRIKTKDTKNRDNVRQIMISYSWKHQNVLRKIWDKLKLSGYTVWMDIENMSGSTLQAMAEAVESSHVVLVCMSQKYKDSPNCRAEAEYAFKKMKTIIPLNMDSGYEPDGWLGILVGTKLVFDFSGKYPFENKLEHLLKELDISFGNKVSSTKHGRVIREVPKDTVDAVPVSISSRNVSHPNYRKSLDSVRKWTQRDVEEWVVKYNLPREEFGCLKGRDLAALIAMRAEAPDYFYDCLMKNLKVRSLNNLSAIDLFVEAIEDLWN